MLLENTTKKKNENNREFIYRVIKENIMTLNLKPGECIRLRVIIFSLITL